MMSKAQITDWKIGNGITLLFSSTYPDGLDRCMLVYFLRGEQETNDWNQQLIPDTVVVDSSSSGRNDPKIIRQ